MRIFKPIIWKISQEGINQAIHFACKKLFFSVDRHGLPPRNLTQKLNDKIVGDIAESAVLEFLKAEGIKTCLYDEIRQDNFEHPDFGWDISLGESISDWQGINPHKSWPKISGSIRSSHVFFNKEGINELIRRFNFMVHALPGKSIKECLTSDLEIQIFYNKEKSSLGSQQITPLLVQECIESIDDCDQIDNLLHISQRLGECYLIAWNLKTRIIEDSYNMDRRTWFVKNGKYRKKMWSAPLRHGRNMSQLVDLLRAYERVVT